jgi:TAG lipase/lysophosphatidylethanolamine acyltransferase
MDYDAWRETPHDKYYDNRLIRERFVAIMEARKEDNIMELIAILRSGLVRNLGNITDHHLFNYAYGGTKDVIDAYVTEVARAIEYVTHFPITSELQGGLSQQAKLDTLHDTRQAFGRTALVLQGGSIFGLCHIGVVKALHLRGLLPRIIVGTATGALIAALVGVHTETELLKFLTPEGIDLTAFMRRSDSMDPAAATNGYNFEDESWFATTIRRLKRLLRQGQLLDVAVLEECVKANVGELTFEEAYRKTKRVLNITVPTTNTGVPILLNYLTSPHVVSKIFLWMNLFLIDYS